MSVDAEPTVNPWLQGNFAPVHDELTTGSLPVTGEIPGALAGEYLRNGFNPAVTPRPSYHWFDGDGMLHGVRLEGGTATHRNRWVQTKGLQAERRAGHVVIAHGDTVIEDGDHVIVFCLSKKLVRKVEALFQVGVGFF